MPPERPTAVPDGASADARSRRHGLLLAGVLLIAAALRFHHLDSQLWLDEVSALMGSMSRPAWEIATRWPGAASHVLYEILGRVALVLFGPAPWAIRLPAALAGVLGVWATYRLALRFFTARAALVAAGLTAVSYHEVFYSQNARGYTLLMLFFLLATDRLAAMVQAGRITPRDGALYALFGALAGYSQIFGVVIIPAQALALALWSRTRRQRSFPLRPFLSWALAGVLLTGLLYAPFILAVLSFLRERSASAAEGASLGIGVLREALEGLTAGLGGAVGLTVAAAVGLIGVGLWLRRAPVTLTALVAPLLVEVTIFAALRAPVHPRYFAIALPVVILIGGTGLTRVVASAAAAAGPARGRTLAGTALALLVLSSAYPLLRYYRYPKQDYLGAMAYVERNAEPGDPKLAIQMAGHVMDDLYGGGGFTTVESIDQLTRLERDAMGKDVWVVTTLEGTVAAADPALMQHIHDDYERVETFPGTVGDGYMRIYRRRIGP